MPGLIFRSVTDKQHGVNLFRSLKQQDVCLFRIRKQQGISLFRSSKRQYVNLFRSRKQQDVSLFMIRKQQDISPFRAASGNTSICSRVSNNRINAVYKRLNHPIALILKIWINGAD
jgi:hypothetical protein